jgi:hypothetical protein
MFIRQRTVVPEVEGRAVGRVLRGRRLRSRRYTWLAISPYGVKLGERMFRKEAIALVRRVVLATYALRQAIEKAERSDL